MGTPPVPAVMEVARPWRRSPRHAIKEITADILKLYRENTNLPNCFSRDSLDLESYDKVKGKIMFKLINADYNKALLEQIPHRLYLDLAIVFYLEFGEDERGNYSALIYNSHRELWKVSTETLYQQAMENTQRDYPATIKSIIQIISGYEDCVDTKSGEYGDMPPFYVLSNSSALNGAGTILYKNVLSDFSAEKKCDLYILPSSLYEVLLFPSDGKIDARKLKRMVEEINQQEVSDSDRLSDSVYYYDCTRNQVSIAA